MSSFCTVLISQPSLLSFETVGRKGVLLLTKKQKLDLGILIAVDRFTSGANAHTLRGLANAYVLACENGQLRRAEEYRTGLLRELGRVRELANRKLSFTPKVSC